MSERWIRAQVGGLDRLFLHVTVRLHRQLCTIVIVLALALLLAHSNSTIDNDVI